MDIEALNIPVAKIKQFHRVGIETIENLLMYFPRRYLYYGKCITLDELEENVGKQVSICGTVTSVTSGFNKVARVTVVLKDSFGKTINVVWFNQLYIKNLLYNDMLILVHGKLAYNEKYGSYSLYPDYYCANADHFGDIVPVYKKVPGMSTDYLRSCIRTVFETMDYMSVIDRGQYIADSLAQSVGVDDFKTVLRLAHFPKSMDDCDRVQRWKTADLLAAFATEMVARNMSAQSTSPYKFKREVCERAKAKILSRLKYTLTEDQTRVISNMEETLCSGKRLNALLQGDVGCGKSIVAFILAVMAVENGYQAAIMAPTQVLAEQHYLDLCNLLQGTDVQIEFLHTGIKAAEKRKILTRISSGKSSIVVGTHAVLSDGVQFQSLAITVVDEEHRFGVKQREKLMQKASSGTHNISMSATPIPRSLALATIGENTEIENIKTMPAGRLPVTTIVYSNAQKTYDAMLRQIRAGHQCYVVCPLIQDSDSDKISDVMSVESALAEMQEYYGESSNVRISAITGKMKPVEVQARIEAFKQGNVDILLSTTIVEVGVNVPNATVMVIRNAERFGLSQLHQLRGRVGRSSLQSYCVLLSRDKSNERLQAMARTTDGFEIAEADMKLRGTGNLVGVEQSGYDKCVTAMLQNQALYQGLYNEIKKMAETSRQYNSLRDFANVRYGNAAH